MIALVLSACGQGFVSKAPSESDFLTGAKNENGVPYTAAADSAELQRLKDSIDQKRATNLQLASRIDSVTAQRTKDKLEIKVLIRDLSPGQFTFNAELKTSAGKLGARDVSAPSTDLKLSVLCLDGECHSMEIRLKNRSAEAGLIQRTRQGQINVLGPFNLENRASALTQLSSGSDQNGQVIFVTTEIAWGPSRFHLTSGKLTAGGDLIATGEQDERVAVTLEGAAPLDARLLGNSNRGDLLIRVSDLGAWAFLRLSLPRSGTRPPTAPIVAEAAPSETKLIPWNPQHPVTAAFQKDRAHPEIQERIEKWKTSSRLVKFANRVRPNVDALANLLNEKQMPADLIFITLIESTYFVEDGFPVQKSNKGAVGPWQFMPDTAGDFGLKLSPCDERGDLYLSTKAAATYFSRLFRMFPGDPKLAIMAYNWGQGSVGRAVICLNEVDRAKCMERKISELTDFSKKLRELQEAGIDFWAIHELNIAPRESTEYVMNFLAANFVGREPVRNGLAIETTNAARPVAPQLCSR